MSDYLKAELDKRDSKYKVDTRAGESLHNAYAAFGGSLGVQEETVSEIHSDSLQESVIAWKDLYTNETAANRSKQFEVEAENLQLQTALKQHRRENECLRQRVKELDISRRELKERGQDWQGRYEEEAKCRLNVLQLEEEKVKLQKEVMRSRRVYEQSEGSNRGLVNLRDAEQDRHDEHARQIDEDNKKYR